MRMSGLPDRLPKTSALSVTAFALGIVFFAAIWCEWHQTLSPESARYQADYPDAIRSGFDLVYGLGKLAWLAGTVAGVVGIARIIVSRRGGFYPILASAPLVALGTILQAPQSNYPSVETTTAFFLWCSTCAIWGIVVALAGVRLFTKVRTG